ncbi:MULTISPECIES: hypothetical protein [unclassified Ensifer]|uniref:hypothetical protein n=1 Tax=unclassified Ensifer TaxID=2633371 RepID=UPI0008139E2A|nr:MULTISPECIES: hypothetical protein [unclassified Ensifer]OCP00739.1 hypothetical protein BC362_23780 [Ensifer sp. LC14]OCP04597.1 hypothetical protein BBX50_25265 [Ensifer sp. LC11]OCP09650.1 hypothetical protein BC374_03655 [Ensifer sp. LC13]OCP30696.1 hypothetical protein BC364_24945 [Ensifer sp. LC499]
MRGKGDDFEKIGVPAELVQALADVSLLNSRVNSVEEDNKENSKTLKEVSVAIERLNSTIQKPWYKDTRFWVGISTIPSLILGGWLLKLFASDPSILRLIHKGFGTEIAIESSLKEESNLEASVAEVIQRKLSPRAKDFDSAIVDNLSAQFAKTSTLSQMIIKDVEVDTNIKHVDFLTLGLVRPKEASWRKCEAAEATSPSGLCLDATGDAFVDSATSFFGAERGYKIDVTIGVFVREVRTELLPGQVVYQPVTGATPLSAILKIEIDDVGQNPIKHRDSFNYTVGGQSYTFAHYKLEGLKLPDDSGFTNFPLHTLNVAVLPGTTNKVVNIAIVVRKAKQAQP